MLINFFLYVKEQYCLFRENIDGSEGRCSLNLSEIALIEIFCYRDLLSYYA